MADKWNLDGVSVDTDDNMTVTGALTVSEGLTVEGASIVFSDLPTSDPEVAGQLWSDSGIVTVSGGPVG